MTPQVESPIHPLAPSFAVPHDASRARHVEVQNFMMTSKERSPRVSSFTRINQYAAGKSSSSSPVKEILKNRLSLRVQTLRVVLRTKPADGRRSSDFAPPTDGSELTHFERWPANAAHPAKARPLATSHPSILHNSRPWMRSLATKNRVPPTSVSHRGWAVCDAVQMSLTMTVPASVSSLLQSSAPLGAVVGHEDQGAPRPTPRGVPRRGGFGRDMATDTGGNSSLGCGRAAIIDVEFER